MPRRGILAEKARDQTTSHRMWDQRSNQDIRIHCRELNLWFPPPLHMRQAFSLLVRRLEWILLKYREVRAHCIRATLVTRRRYRHHCQTSRSMTSPSTPSGGHAHSPITPESPMLHTPLDTFGSILGGLSSPTNQAAAAQTSFVSLGPIDESDLFDDQLDDSRSVTPNQGANVIEVQVHPPPGKIKQQPAVEGEPQQIRRERSASWNDLKAAFSHSKRRLSPNNATPESLSPTTPTFPHQAGTPTEAPNGGALEDSTTKSFFGRSRAEKPACQSRERRRHISRSIHFFEGCQS